MFRPKRYVLVLSAWLIVQPAWAVQWQSIAPGIEYAEMQLPGPVEVFVARADRQHKGWTIDVMMAKGLAKGAREIVPEMARRADDSVNFLGERYDAKVAINGDYFNPTTGVPFGGQVVGGWFVRRYPEYSGGSGFLWMLDGRAVMGGNVRNAAKWQRVRFADGTEMNIHKLNDPRGQDELALYTWQYADRTDAADAGVGVLVRMSAPVVIMPDGGGVPGEIVSVVESKGGTLLPYDHVVLSGHGRAAEKLRQHAKKGEQLRVELTLADYGNEDLGLAPADWKGAYAGMGAATYILVNGKVPRHWEAKAEKLAREGKRHGSVVKDPRTLVAFNERYVYFVVIDGRSNRSIGMNFTEAGEFCRDHLKADFAVTQDGGGSSIMWVDGEVRNRPSDKNKAGETVFRPVANGYLMATLQPAEWSRKFSPDERIVTAKNVELRLGPGSQFGVADELKAGASGTIVSHKLTGIRAKGTFWWNCCFANAEGWLPQDALESATR